MSDDTRPEVEPLSDVAWARLERGLWARMDGSVTVQVAQPRSRRWMWIAAPMVAAAAAAVLFVATRDSSTEHKEIATGSDAGDVRVVAPPNAPAMASFNDAHIELAPASAIVMRQSATVIERGSAWFAVAPRVDRPAFVVLAGDAKVRVVGTKFRVARTDDRVAVEVEHGLVEVTFRGEPVQIHANESWSSEQPDKVSRLKTAVVTPKPDEPTDPIEIAPPQPAPKKAPPPIVGTKVKPEPKPEPKVEPKEPNPTLEDERVKYERLTAIEKKDPAAAMVGYLELSQRSGRWAANALYAAGRLAADRRDPRAATILGVYIKRFPNGANVDDARSLLARISAGSR